MWTLKALIRQLLYLSSLQDRNLLAIFCSFDFMQSHEYTPASQRLRKVALEASTRIQRRNELIARKLSETHQRPPSPLEKTTNSDTNHTIQSSSAFDKSQRLQELKSGYSHLQKRLESVIHPSKPDSIAPTNGLVLHAEMNERQLQTATSLTDHVFNRSKPFDTDHHNLFPESQNDQSFLSKPNTRADILSSIPNVEKPITAGEETFNFIRRLQQENVNDSELLLQYQALVHDEEGDALKSLSPIAGNGHQEFSSTTLSQKRLIPEPSSNQQPITQIVPHIFSLLQYQVHQPIPRMDIHLELQHNIHDAEDDWNELNPDEEKLEDKTIVHEAAVQCMIIPSATKYTDRQAAHRHHDANVSFDHAKQADRIVSQETAALSNNLILQKSVACIMNGLYLHRWIKKTNPLIGAWTEQSKNYISAKALGLHLNEDSLRFVFFNSSLEWLNWKHPQRTIREGFLKTEHLQKVQKCSIVFDRKESTQLQSMFMDEYPALLLHFRDCFLILTSQDHVKITEFFDGLECLRRYKDRLPLLRSLLPKATR